MTLTSAKDLVADARARIENLTPEQLSDELAHDEVVLVDLREHAERERDGIIPAAVHVPGGCWSSAPIRRCLPIGKSLIRLAGSSSTARSAAARRSPRAPLEPWAIATSPTWTAASRRGESPAAQSSPGSSRGRHSR